MKTVTFKKNIQLHDNVQTMTSLEIAELTGKQHKHLMEAIRKMEPAWEKVHGSKFRLMFREVEIGNGAVRRDPCYSLTKTETLYIATKFNDEARARLVLRWEELEMERLGANFTNLHEIISIRDNSRNSCQNNLALPAKQIIAAADEIIGEGLRMLNEDAEDTLTATQVAKTFNMTVFDFNAVLRDMGIQYRRDGHWNISDDLADRNLVRLRTHVSYSLKGQKKVKVYMTWTLDGLRFLNSKLGYPNF
jgi:phage regulator Rha-like protein